MKFEVSIAGAPDDAPGVIALIETLTDYAVTSIADIALQGDGMHCITFWPRADGAPMRVELEQLQSAIAEAVDRLANYDGGKYARLLDED